MFVPIALFASLSLRGLGTRREAKRAMRVEGENRDSSSEAFSFLELLVLKWPSGEWTRACLVLCSAQEGITVRRFYLVDYSTFRNP